MSIHRGDSGHIKSHWDNHKKCIYCSHCFRESTCSTCSSWSNSIWELSEKRKLILPEREPCPAKRSLLMCLFHQTREKENMGTLPLMALLPGIRPILVATPWVLLPKGVQVHWSPGILRPTH